MNNDSISRDCAQVGGQTANNFNTEGAIAPVTRLCVPAGPRLPRSSLASLQLSKPRTPEEMQKLAEEVWRKRGLALIDPLLINDDFARQALINEANRLYGRKAAKGLEVCV